MMNLSLRTIGGRDFTIFDDGQQVGRIRYAQERSPPRWIWNVLVQVPTPGGLPLGTASSLEAAKAEFKEAWNAFKLRHTAEQLAAAYRSMNLREQNR